jgi:rod shape determining protein RodA
MARIIMLIVAFADFINRRRGELDTLSQILPCLAYMGIPFILIMMQPDLGTALVYIAITIIMLFIAGANPRILVALIVGAILLVGLVFLLHFHWGMPIPLEDYQLKRLTVFLDPYNDGQGGRGAGWNTIQSLVAIGSGGLAGKGLYNGSQVQLNFLPEHHTDFIYAVILPRLAAVKVAFRYPMLLDKMALNILPPSSGSTGRRLKRARKQFILAKRLNHVP